MKALIFTEGGAKIGFGHITRCCALRDAFKATGIPAELIVNGDASVKKQFSGQYDQFFNWITHARKFSELIQRAHIVVVDSYLAPLSLYKKIAAFVPVPVFIDDYVRLPYPRGFVVSGAIGAEKFPYSQDQAIRYLLGAKYALLRKDFWKISVRRVRRQIRDVLVSFGGIRRSDFTQRLLSHLSPLFPHWRFHVVLPRDSGSFTVRKNVRYYFGLTAAKMRSLMLRADLAISGGGQTTNELSACGLPVIGICFSDNQRLNIRGWQKCGVLKCAGDAGQNDILRRVERFIKNLHYPERCAMSSSGRRFMDGQGALRIVSQLTRSPLELCLVGSRDRRQIYLCSKDPQVRQASFRPSRISWAEHCAWFKKRIQVPGSPFYKILWLNRPAGQIRFDCHGNKAKISASLCRSFRGKGLGAPSLRLASNKLFSETDVRIIDAFIKSRNCTSFKVFRRAGFRPAGRELINGQKAHHLILRKRTYEKK
jgi:spore coat polysaccharide biosynthesis predicted glycosyltransferase SpsG/RimJ/RimL family protein N-acetyltransferase